MKFKKKLEATLLGYLFCMLNIYMTVSNYPIVGIGFGFVSCYFFIKALRIKGDQSGDLANNCITMSDKWKQFNFLRK